MREYGYLTYLWNCPAVKFFFMLINNLAEQVLESVVEPLYMLKIANAQKGCQSFDRQEKIVFYPIFKI